MVVGRGARFIPPSCHCYGWLAPCIMVVWSAVVSFAGASVPKAAAECVCVGGWVFREFLCCMGTCPSFSSS
jgi:hypothetical protein